MLPWEGQWICNLKRCWKLSAVLSNNKTLLLWKGGTCIFAHFCTLHMNIKSMWQLTDLLVKFSWRVINFHHQPEESNLTFCFIIKLQYARRFQGTARFPPFPGHFINTNSFSCSRQCPVLLLRLCATVHLKGSKNIEPGNTKTEAFSIRQKPLDISFLRSVKLNEITYFLL